VNGFWKRFHPHAPKTRAELAANAVVIVACFPFFFLANAIVSLGEP
jgi:hypothetical protein